MASMMRADEAPDTIHRRLSAEFARFASFELSLGDAAATARCLSTLIESEIIPRLVVAHAADARPIAEEAVSPATTTAITPADIEALAMLALGVEADGVLGHVDTVLTRGASIDALLVELLAPTARLLGEYWESDRCNFLDVTMALWRLQEVVHELATRVPVGWTGGNGHRALFVSMPGDQHGFGTVVIDELFRGAGWQSDRMTDADTPDLLRRVADESFDLVGLTISCDCHIARLPSIIAALRNISRNPRLCVMVGGRIFVADPDLAAEVGADGTAGDARLALALASKLVRARTLAAEACS